MGEICPDTGNADRNTTDGQTVFIRAQSFNDGWRIVFLSRYSLHLLQRCNTE